MNSFATLWESVLKKLESYYQANRNAIAYEMYIKSLSPAFEENGKYIFKVSNDLAREQVEERFAPLIFQKMKEAYQEMHGQGRRNRTRLFYAGRAEPIPARPPGRASLFRRHRAQPELYLRYLCRRQDE